MDLQVLHGFSAAWMLFASKLQLIKDPVVSWGSAWPLATSLNRRTRLLVF
jgi:hypothetical protein